MSSKTLNLKEAAKVLEIHRKTLAIWIRELKYDLPYRRPAKQYIFEESDVLHLKKMLQHHSTTKFPSEEGR